MGRTRQHRQGRRHRASIILVAALTALMLLAVAGPAVAGPPPSTLLDLSALQTKLDSGPIDGYMKTSMSGTTVTNIPVRVLAIVDGFYWGKLIMFESTDAAITDIGGIAAGMSGSPIYVDDGGTDKLIGAVSYGDWFTLRGTGLATPIEYMTALQDKYASAEARTGDARMVKLETPVQTSLGTVEKLVLATDAKAASTAAGADKAVMHPLALARISGLSSGSAAYKALAAKLEDSGLTVMPAQTTSNAAPVTTPDLKPGSPCGITFSSGLYTMSVLGTLTYTDDDTVLLFGHPVLGGYSGYDIGIGAMRGTLTGATVDAVWPTTCEPYKMMTPADAKGIATQDRSAGVVAQIGGSETRFPVTTTATFDGGDPVTDTTAVSEWFATVYWPDYFDWGYPYGGATTNVAVAGLYHELDGDSLTGSATTTTTVVASDGTDEYTFTRENIWDNNSDQTWYGLADVATGDVTTIMANVLSDPYGTRNVEIKSVDVNAAFSSSRKFAGLADVRLQRALRPGDNDVAVDYYRYGSTDLQTLHATLQIPEGTGLSGYLDVMSAATAAEWGYYDDYSGNSPAVDPETLAQVAARLEGASTNGDLIVAYTPSGSYDYYDDYSDGPSVAALSTTSTDRVFSGELSKKTREVQLRARPSTVALGLPVLVRGVVESATDDVEVAIYLRPAGTPDPTVPTLTVTATEDEGSAYFACMLPPANHNVQITAEAPAIDEDGLPGAAMITVKVKARVSLAVARSGGRWHCTATLRPRDAGGSVEFQRRVGGHWKHLATVAVNGHGKARTSVATKAAPRVRARLTGSEMNAASAWVVWH